MLHKCNVTEKPNIFQQLLTGNSPILSAAANGQVLRQAVVPFACMMRHTPVCIFSCAQVGLRKARERELAKLDEKSTSSGIAEPYAR